MWDCVSASVEDKTHMLRLYLQFVNNLFNELAFSAKIPQFLNSSIPKSLNLLQIDIESVQKS